MFFDFRSKKKLGDTVNRIFNSLKEKQFKKSTNLPSFLDHTKIIPDVELKDSPISLPISKKTKSQTLSQIRAYKGIDVINKKTFDELFDEIKEGYFKFSHNEGCNKEDIKDPNQDYLLKLTLNALKNEIDLNKEYYIAYHTHKPEYTFLFDVFQQIYRWGLLNNAQQLSLRLIKSCEFKDSEQSMDTFLSQAALLTRTKTGEYAFEEDKHIHFDQIPKPSSLLLSLNLSLFANIKNFGASSIILGLAGKSFRSINTEEILTQTLNDCNIGKEFIPKILRLKQQFLRHQRKGVLLQFFIKKDIIDRIAYLANVGGKPVNEKISSETWDTKKKRTKVSSFLEKFINEPQALNAALNNFTDNDQKFVFNVNGARSLSQIQARLWMPAKEVYDPNFVIVKRYNFAPDDYVDKEYYTKLNEIFEEIIKDLIRKKLLNQIGDYDLMQTPLETFEKEITPLIVEESKRTQSCKSKTSRSFQAEVENLLYNTAQKESIDHETQEKIKSTLTSILYQEKSEQFSGKTTPLIIAVKMNNLSLVNLLLSIDGYDPKFNAKNTNGQTALYLAKMNARSSVGSKILDRLIKHVEIYPKLLDSMSPVNIATLSKIDSIKPIVFRKFEENLLQNNPEIISMGKELIKNVNESEFKAITENIFSVIAEAENPRTQNICLNLLKFSVIREIQNAECINKAFACSIPFCESKVLVVKKTAIDLQNTIGKKLTELYLGNQREKYHSFQEFIYQANTNEIEKLHQQAKKMAQSNSGDLQELAILFYDSIIRNYKANKQISIDAFWVIKQFADTNDISRQIDLINLFQPLMFLGNKYESHIRDIAPNLITKIYTKSIESDKNFNRLLVWQQKKLLHGLLNILEYLSNKQILDASFLLIAEKIIKKIKLQEKEQL